MIIHHGVYFHSPHDFKSFFSEDTPFATLNIIKRLGQLEKPEGNTINVGTKYFFSFPITHGAQNWVVFGVGETVYTLQPERRGTVRVPYLQFFLMPLQDYVSSGIVIDPKKLERYLRPYEEVFNEYVKNNRTVKCSTFDETIGSKSENKQVSLNLFVKEKCDKNYTDTYDEGVRQYFDTIQEYPKIIRWAYSTIITPLDEMYTANYVAVYRQKGVRIEAAETDNMPVNDDACYREFDQFVKNNLQKDLETLLTSERLEDIYTAYNKFVLMKKKPPQESQGAVIPAIGVPLNTERPRSEGHTVTVNQPRLDEINEPKRAEMQRVEAPAKVAELPKKTVDSRDAIRQIVESAQRTQTEVRNAQSLEIALNLILDTISVIESAVKDVEGNPDSYLLGEPIGKAYNSLTYCIRYVKSEIEKKRPGFSDAKEEIILDFMKNKSKITFVRKKYVNKAAPAIDSFVISLKEIFLAMEKAKIIISEAVIHRRFEDYRAEYFLEKGILQASSEFAGTALGLEKT